MNSEQERALRVRALELALQTRAQSVSNDEVIAIAERYFEFLKREESK